MGENWKAYVSFIHFNRDALWQALRTDDMGGKLLNIIRSMYYVKIKT